MPLFVTFLAVPIDAASGCAVLRELAGIIVRDPPDNFVARRQNQAMRARTPRAVETISSAAGSACAPP